MTSVFPLALLLCLSSGLLTAYGEPCCPPGWTQFGSRCFAFYIQANSWSNAEAFCISAGGNLASIHSDKEHGFIKNYIFQMTGAQTTAWIGGTDAVKPLTWFWSDGSKFDYASWNAGEPNNFGGNEFCLTMNWGGANWNDLPCANKVSFVCSMNLCV